MSFFTKCFSSNTAKPVVKQIAKSASTIGSNVGSTIAPNVGSTIAPNVGSTIAPTIAPNAVSTVANGAPLPLTIQCGDELNLDHIQLNNISLKEFDIVVNNKALEIANEKIKNYEESDVFKQLVNTTVYQKLKPDLEKYQKQIYDHYQESIDKKADKIAEAKYSAYVNNFLKEKEAEYNKKIEIATITKVEQYFDTLLLRTPKKEDLKKLNLMKNVKLNKLILETSYKIFTANYKGEKFILIDKLSYYDSDVMKSDYIKMVEALNSNGYLIYEYSEITYKNGNSYKKSYLKISWDEKNNNSIVKSCG
jgi:hypothetical protein